MKTRLHIQLCAVATVLFLASTAFGQEDVTISKSRLQELEKKERELDKLKQQQKATPVPAPAPAQPIVVHQSPPMATLPAFKPGETVQAMDLANYYQEDAAAADQRYRRHEFTVRGEIVGFEKPLLRRDYVVLLKTPVPAIKLACDLIPQERFSAVFTVNHGTELVGLQNGTRIPAAKIGDTVAVDGVCKGLHGGTINISGLSLTVIK